MTAQISPLNLDVSNTVDVTDPNAVARRVIEIFDARFGDAANASLIERLVADFARLYRGDYPGFHACDVKYHDIQHVLDVTLAMARLIDGYEQSHAPKQQLGADMALAGIACALFHDAGYIRRVGDTRNTSGAAYTRTHVSRSARFLLEYLPEIGLQSFAELCARVVQFTGYQLKAADIPVESQRERWLGELLGTADLIAQMADRDYPRKCQEHLYEEFEIGGLAGQNGDCAQDGMVYQSPEHLLATTPEFMRNALEVRLAGEFNCVYRYAEVHFGGTNLYLQAIERNQAAFDVLNAGSEPAGRKRKASAV